MTDQLLLYDQAFVTWLTNNLPTLLPGVTTQIVVATPKRTFADVLSGKLINNDLLTLPRVSLTRLGYSIDNNRYNFNRIRKLGWDSSVKHDKIISAKFPIPITISYQVDLWTKYVKEMNVWLQKFMYDFDSTMVYLHVDTGSVFGDKIFPLIIDSENIQDTSEIEPGIEERLIRKTLTFKADGWLFDEEFVKYPVARRFEAQLRDTDTDELYDTVYCPPIEILGVGDGIVQHFTFTLSRPPVLNDTIVINATCLGNNVIVIDTASGGLITGSTVIGSIVYSSGLVDLTFLLPPDNGTNIKATYFTDLS